MRKYLKCDYNEYGIVGESTKYQNYCVGDIVAFNTKYDDKINIGLIVYCPSDKKYGIFGWCTVPLCEFKIIHKIISWYNINNDILEEIIEDMEIIEVEEKEMTLREIEEELGYKIKIKS